MAIAIVEDLWGRIRAHIDDKIAAAQSAADRAEAAAQSASTGVQADTVGRLHLTPDLRGEIDGKAAGDHTHTPASIGAAPASHTHSQYATTAQVEARTPEIRVVSSPDLATSPGVLYVVMED